MYPYKNYIYFPITYIWIYNLSANDNLWLGTIEPYKTIIIVFYSLAVNYGHGRGCELLLLFGGLLCVKLDFYANFNIESQKKDVLPMFIVSLI